MVIVPRLPIAGARALSVWNLIDSFADATGTAAAASTAAVLVDILPEEWPGYSVNSCVIIVFVKVIIFY